jgi:hypothetical protein
MNERQADFFESPIEEVRDIVRRNLFAIYAGMISSNSSPAVVSRAGQMTTCA